MIEHLWTRPRIGPYLDDALAPFDIVRVSMHLVECRNCTQKVRWLHDVKRSLAVMGRTGPHPAGFPDGG